MYLYFGLFSLFSGLYFFFQSISTIFETDLSVGIIFCAAVYYAIFPWFIFEFVKKKFNKALVFISLLFFLAFLVFIIVPDDSPFAYWQIIAHTGLIGLIICIVSANIEYGRKHSSGSNQFVIISVLFILLALEEMSSNYFGFGVSADNFTHILPLDIYPLLFTVVMGYRMSQDFVNKKRVELQTVKNELSEKKLRVLELERLRLIDEINFKKRDLTDFGIEITRKRDFIKELLKQLSLLKKQTQIKSTDLNEIIAHSRSQMKIDEHLDYFHQNVELINHEFNNSLKELYPSLTENELHLSSLLRLKLNTKEISKIKNISPDSVKVMRYRLRKKFSLSKGVNLVDFLQQF